MPAINKASRAPISPRSRKKRINGAQMLTNITFLFLILVVLHMAFFSNNNGDSSRNQKQQSRSVGKTTRLQTYEETKKKKEIADHPFAGVSKVASYRKPEHEKDVAGLASVEKAFFNHDDNVAAPTSSESEDEADDTDRNNAPVDAAEDQMWIDPDEKKKFAKDVNTASEDLAENVQFLKATVAATLEHLRDEAYSQIELEMREVKEQAEEFKDTLRGTMRRVLDVLLGDNNNNIEIRTKAEDMVFDRLVLKLQDQFEEQVILWITDVSDDLDARVAEWEDQGLDVNEIEEELTEVEEDEKVPEMRIETGHITTDVIRQIPYSIPTVCKETLEEMLEFLGQHAELVFDNEDFLDLDTPLPNGVKFKDEQLLEAIEDVGKGAGSRGEDDDIISSVKASDSENKKMKNKSTIAEDLDSNTHNENMGNGTGTRDAPDVSSLLIHDKNKIAAKRVGESSPVIQTGSKIGSPTDSVNSTVVGTSKDQEAKEIDVTINSPAGNATATHIGSSLQRKTAIEKNESDSWSNVTVVEEIMGKGDSPADESTKEGVNADSKSEIGVGKEDIIDAA